MKEKAEGLHTAVYMFSPAKQNIDKYVSIPLQGLLTIYYVPDTALSTWHVSVNKGDEDVNWPNKTALSVMWSCDRCYGKEESRSG